jgi:hypothetical protein
MNDLTAMLGFWHTRLGLPVHLVPTSSLNRYKTWPTLAFKETKTNRIRSLTVLFRALLTALLLTSMFLATGPRDHLVAVQRSAVHFAFPPTVQRVQGSDICIDTSCFVIATAYHVQRLVGRANLGVAGGRTEKVLSVANDSDTNKPDVFVGHHIFSYNH